MTGQVQPMVRMYYLGAYLKKKKMYIFIFMQDYIKKSTGNYKIIFREINSAKEKGNSYEI